MSKNNNRLSESFENKSLKDINRSMELKSKSATKHNSQFFNNIQQ